MRRITVGLGTALLALGLCAAYVGPASSWSWTLLLPGAAFLLAGAIPRRPQDNPEEDEMPPTIDGRSQATGLMRYKMEADRDDKSVL